MGETEQNHYRQAEAALMQVAAAVQRQEQVDLTEPTHLAAAIVDSLLENDQLVVEALSSPPGPPLVTNLINVGILGTKVGIGLGYYGEELRRLALAGLVHDIGIFAVPQQLLTKTGRLTQEERALVEQHPRLGREVIERLGKDYVWLADVVLQAHERGNGQGYPNRLKGREIDELAQILGLVDIFDALVSPRPYRRRLLPHEAIRELLNTERTAFPREIIKALVEQLSVYPLGTKVRLNSGEEGVVFRITPSYPSRPVLYVTGENEHSANAAPRYLDLGLMPHLSIADTVDPPALDRVTFSAVSPAVETAGPAPNASDQFAALLESLDAIAGVIQSAVEHTTAVPLPGRPSSVVNASEQATHVRREILGLFVLEAREWLNQIQTALERLDSTSEQPRRAKLTTILWQSVNNLARSASTVGLTAVEDMATTLLPILQAAGKHERAVAVHHVRSLRKGLLQISKAVQELGQYESAVPPDFASPLAPAEPEGSPGDESVLLKKAEAVTPVEGSDQDDSKSTAASISILEALRQLHVARSRSVQPVRDVLETVIQRAERSTAQTSEAVDARTIGRILKDLDELDEQCLRQMQTHVPVVVNRLGQIGRANEAQALSPQALEPIFQDIDVLSEAAERVSAANIALFLHGLRTFLRVTAHQSPAAVRVRLDAVKERLVALIPLAQQWVDIGRVERSAIFDILPLA